MSTPLHAVALRFSRMAHNFRRITQALGPLLMLYGRYTPISTGFYVTPRKPANSNTWRPAHDKR